MRKWHLFSVLLLAGAIILISISLAIGEGQIGIFLIFPFLIASGPLAALGALLLFSAILAFLIGYATAGDRNQPDLRVTIGSEREKTQDGGQYGGVVMLGPFPIAFGSNRKIAKWMIIIGIALFLALLILSIVLISRSS